MSSVTFVHPHPAKAVGQNEMPFGSDTRVIPSNIVLDTGPGPPRKEEIWSKNPPPQFAAMPPIAKLLWPLL